ncbi:unnamed protein product, partial [Amoebophrya sp. A25]
ERQLSPVEVARGSVYYAACCNNALKHLRKKTVQQRKDYLQRIMQFLITWENSKKVGFQPVAQMAASGTSGGKVGAAASSQTSNRIGQGQQRQLQQSGKGAVAPAMSSPERPRTAPVEAKGSATAGTTAPDGPGGSRVGALTGKGSSST